MESISRTNPKMRDISVQKPTVKNPDIKRMGFMERLPLVVATHRA